jgi:hypothetical protein
MPDLADGVLDDCAQVGVPCRRGDSVAGHDPLGGDQRPHDPPRPVRAEQDLPAAEIERDTAGHAACRLPRADPLSNRLRGQLARQPCPAEVPYSSAAGNHVLVVLCLLRFLPVQFPEHSLFDLVVSHLGRRLHLPAASGC